MDDKRKLELYENLLGRLCDFCGSYERYIFELWCSGFTREEIKAELSWSMNEVELTKYMEYYDNNYGENVEAEA